MPDEEPQRSLKDPCAPERRTEEPRQIPRLRVVNAFSIYQGLPVLTQMSTEEDEVRPTIGHEVGHAIRICLWGGCSHSMTRDCLPSVMPGIFVGGPPSMADTAKFDAFDFQQIRLRE